eukprot:1561150-Rhodomonas_salina.2
MILGALAARPATVTGRAGGRRRRCRSSARGILITDSCNKFFSDARLEHSLSVALAPVSSDSESKSACQASS